MTAFLLSAGPALACPGDCDANGAVTVDEVVRGVRTAIDADPPATCPAADVDGDGAVRISELILAVRALLEGCPTPMPTPTPPAAEDTHAPRPHSPRLR